jgi:hypothetical protein
MSSRDGVRFEEKPVARIFALAALACALALGNAAPGLSQDWAQKLFKTRSHDFGSVARGAKAEFSFELVNCFKEDIHVAGVRSSCGCTTPTVSQPTVKTWEKTQIVASLNTRTFTGQKNATITVSIDQPFPAEVQLSVSAYIRRDVVFSPGAVQFGSVEEGKPAETTIDVAYAGRDDWRITDVRSANPNLEVELNEKERGGGRVGYSMLVRLKDGAAPGFFLDQLIVVTNDRNMTSIPLAVEGRVVAPLTVSPGSLVLGVLAPGQSVTKQLVVRGNEPFRILDVKCADPSFKFELSDEAKQMHLVPVTFTAGSTAVKIAETIVIKTDLGQGAEASCKATATVE